MKRGETVWFQWSASEVLPAKFVRWVRMRMGTGQKDTNKIGVGALLYFSRNNVLRGVYKIKLYKLHPYTPIYRRARHARYYIHEIRRPDIKRVRGAYISIRVQKADIIVR